MFVNQQYAVDWLKRNASFLVFVVLALLALSATALATDISACGNYSENNTVYTFTANITIANNNRTCVNISGNNNTINGAGYWLLGNAGYWNASNYGFKAVELTGVGNTLTNMSADKFGIALSSSNANNTITFSRATSSGIGLYAAPSCSTNWTGNSGYNNSYGIYSDTSALGTFTNNHIYSSTSTDATFISSAPTDGGNNYWGSCGANCSWYTISTATSNMTSTGDGYADSANPNTNYGSATVETAATTQTGFWGFNITADGAPPAAVISNWNGYICRAAATSCGGSNQLKDVSSNYTEATMTYNTIPTYTTEASQGCNGAINTFCDLGNRSDTKPVLNGNFSFAYYNNCGTAIFYFKEASASYRPKAIINWRAAIADTAATTTRANGSAYTVYKRSLATYGATVCSFSAPNSATGVFVNSELPTANVSILSTQTKNATHDWKNFVCTQGTIYSMTYTVPVLLATNATSCPASHPTQVANFTALDEATDANSSANFSVDFDGYDYTAALGIDYTTVVNSTHAILICGASGWATTSNWAVNMTVSYLNVSTDTREYVLKANNATSTNITIYTLNSTDASIITFILKNQYGSELSGRLIQALRYFPANGTYKLVDMETTDGDGQAYTSLRTHNGVYYMLYVYDGATLEKTFTSELIYCDAGGACEYNLYIPSDYEEPAWWTDYGDVNVSCSYNETSLTDTCDWADGTGVSHVFNMTTKRINASGMTVVCTNQSSSASGSLSCTLTGNTTGSIYTMTFTRHSDLSVLEQRTHDFTEAAFGSVGAVLGFLIIVVCALIGITVPPAAPIMVVVGLVASVWAGFLHVHVAAIAGLVFAALIMAWKQGGG